jgi:DNA repair protein RadC
MTGSASIIIAHNHPSGETDPSDEDTKVTKVMFDAGQILGINLLDHLIFTKDKYFSFKNKGRGEMLSTEAGGRGDRDVGRYREV